MLQPHFLQHRLRGGPCLGLIVPADQGRQHDVLERRELREQMVELEDEPDLPVAELGQRLSSKANTSFPSKCTVPLVGRSRVPRMWRRVVLPTPEAPTMATSSPRVIAKLTPFST